MNQSDFSINSIELSHEQVESIYQRIVDAIENYGIENFEKKTEIQIPELTEEDLIKVYVEMEIYTEWKDDKRHPQDYPEPEEITSRSVMKLKIQLVNIEGDDVNCKQLDYNFEEKIKEHFSI